MKRLGLNYITTAANANEQFFPFPTNDDYRARHIKTVFVGLATSGVQIALYVTGQLFSAMDLTRFAAGDAILEVDIDVPAKQTITVSLKNIAGAALTNVPVVLGYEVDPNSGP